MLFPPTWNLKQGRKCMHNVKLRWIHISESWTILRRSYHLTHCGPTFCYSARLCTRYKRLWLLPSSVIIFLCKTLFWCRRYLLTYLLTQWCRVLLEKLTGLQLVKKFSNRETRDSNPPDNRPQDCLSKFRLNTVAVPCCYPWLESSGMGLWGNY